MSSKMTNDKINSTTNKFYQVLFRLQFVQRVVRNHRRNVEPLLVVKYDTLLARMLTRVGGKPTKKFFNCGVHPKINCSLRTGADKTSGQWKIS